MSTTGSHGPGNRPVIRCGWLAAVLLLILAGSRAAGEWLRTSTIIIAESIVAVYGTREFPCISVRRSSPDVRFGRKADISITG